MKETTRSLYRANMQTGLLSCLLENQAGANSS